MGDERFMVVAFTEHLDEGINLPEWPQHMTIVPWMRGHRLQATNRVIDAVAQFEPLIVRISSEEQFGLANDITVWTLEVDDILKSLHETVLEAANKNSTIVEDMTYTGDKYAPHVSQKPDQPPHHVGELLTFSEISIIGKHATGRVVYKNIEL